MKRIEEERRQRAERNFFDSVNDALLFKSGVAVWPELTNEEADAQANKLIAACVRKAANGCDGNCCSCVFKSGGGGYRFFDGRFVCDLLKEASELPELKKQVRAYKYEIVVANHDIGSYGSDIKRLESQLSSLRPIVENANKTVLESEAKLAELDVEIKRERDRLGV